MEVGCISPKFIGVNFGFQLVTMEFQKVAIDDLLGSSRNLIWEMLQLVQNGKYAFNQNLRRLDIQNESLCKVSSEEMRFVKLGSNY